MEILLWQARTNKGWVLEQLEKKSGVSKATLNRIENGQTSPTMDVMEKVAKALNIDVTQKIYFLTRIRCADGVPMAVEKVHMPFYRFAGIETQDLSKSLYALLKEQYGCECSKAVQSIQAGAASSHDAKLLKIKTGMPVLCISRTTYGMDGAPFEYVDSIYRGDKYIFNVTLQN